MDASKLYMNDIHCMSANFGIEAAVKVLINVNNKNYIGCGKFKTSVIFFVRIKIKIQKIEFRGTLPPPGEYLYWTFIYFQGRQPSRTILPFFILLTLNIRHLSYVHNITDILNFLHLTSFSYTKKTLMSIVKLL